MEAELNGQRYKTNTASALAWNSRFPQYGAAFDGKERSVNALEQAMIEDNKILLVAQKEAKIDDPTPDDIYTMGTIAQIKQC